MSTNAFGHTDDRNLFVLLRVAALLSVIGGAAGYFWGLQALGSSTGITHAIWSGVLAGNIVAWSGAALLGVVGWIVSDVPTEPALVTGEQITRGLEQAISHQPPAQAAAQTSQPEERKLELAA